MSDLRAAVRPGWYLSDDGDCLLCGFVPGSWRYEPTLDNFEIEYNATHPLAGRGAYFYAWEEARVQVPGEHASECPVPAIETACLRGE